MSNKLYWNFTGLFTQAVICMSWEAFPIHPEADHITELWLPVHTGLQQRLLTHFLPSQDSTSRDALQMGHCHCGKFERPCSMHWEHWVDLFTECKTTLPLPHRAPPRTSSSHRNWEKCTQAEPHVQRNRVWKHFAKNHSKSLPTGFEQGRSLKPKTTQLWCKFNIQVWRVLHCNSTVRSVMSEYPQYKIT